MISMKYFNEGILAVSSGYERYQVEKAPVAAAV